MRELLCSPALIDDCSVLWMSDDAGRGVAFGVCEREFFIDNLLVRNHCIIVMIRWTGDCSVRWVSDDAGRGVAFGVCSQKRMY